MTKYYVEVYPSHVVMIRKVVLTSKDISEDFNLVTERFGTKLWEQIVGFKYSSMYTVLQEASRAIYEFEKQKRENKNV